MSFLKQILKNFVASPLTSAIGAGSLYATGTAIAHAPATLSNPLTWLQVLGGVALLGSPDPQKQLQQQIQDTTALQQAVQPPEQQK